MLITLPQADKKDFPLYLRLINEIKSKIHSGEIAAEEKMPSLRKLAHDLDVSRTTAEAAYSQLVAEGYLIASPKRGYFAGSIVSRKPQKVLPPQKPSGMDAPASSHWETGTAWPVVRSMTSHHFLGSW